MHRLVGLLLTVTVGLVLADSAIVTLALPEMLQELDASVAEVAWVLISYNLVLGVLAVPAALRRVRVHPRALAAIGIAVFAGASAWCAAAPTIEVLIVARCVQALGGAFALVGALELLVARSGERRGVAAWVTAGVVGTAAGPVAGGLLTEAISWQAIFIAQVPFAALAVPAALAVREPVPADGPAEEPDLAHRPVVGHNVTLGLLSAALTAALFLLVLLLVEGWRHSPPPRRSRSRSSPWRRWPPARWRGGSGRRPTSRWPPGACWWPAAWWASRYRPRPTWSGRWRPRRSSAWGSGSAWTS
ncbi:MFS transporter [Nocardioides zeae]